MDFFKYILSQAKTIVNSYSQQDVLIYHFFCVIIWEIYTVLSFPRKFATVVWKTIFWRGYSVRTYAIITNSLVFVLSFCFVSQADDALNLADHFFKLQSYDESITEYKRFIFFNPEDKRVGDAFYKMGLAYRAEGRWGEAFDALNAAIRLTDDDKLKDERRIGLGITLIASGDTSLAQLELLKVLKFSQYDTMRRQASYFQGVAHLYAFNWEDAHQAFQEFYSSKVSGESKRVDALLVEAQHLPYKSGTIARTLSTILPGAGQIYAGNRKSGLNALALNSAIAAFCLNRLAKKNYQDATLIVLWLFQRFYIGNIYHAVKGVEDYNDNLNRQHASKVLQILLDN